MTKVVLERQNEDQLRGFDEVVEVCDHAGKRMGYFRPVSSEATSWAQLSRFSDDELRGRCSQISGGRPLTEVLIDLKQLSYLK